MHAAAETRVGNKIMKYILSIFALVFLGINFESWAFEKNNIMEKIINLKIDENNQVFKNLNLIVTGIMFEEIAECPEDSSSYPSGSGVNVFIDANSGENHTKLTLFEISAPYSSKSSVDWNGFRIKLLDVSGHRDTIVELSIKKIE